MEEKIVLCGANAYDKKYYFNQKFDKIPDSIKDELHIICVLFTEEVGGIITFAFGEEGTLVIETNAADDDFYYDEISSGLLVREIRRKKQELLEKKQESVGFELIMTIFEACCTEELEKKFYDLLGGIIEKDVANQPLDDIFEDIKIIVKENDVLHFFKQVGQLMK